MLHCESHLAIVPGATHLFEEPGTLEAAAALPRDWFLSHMARRGNRCGLTGDRPHARWPAGRAIVTPGGGAEAWPERRAWWVRGRSCNGSGRQRCSRGSGGHGGESVDLGQQHLDDRGLRMPASVSKASMATFSLRRVPSHPGPARARPTDVDALGRLATPDPR